MMMRSLTIALTLGATTLTLGETVNFNAAFPDGWLAGVTGTGHPKWSVENGALKQSGAATFASCVKTNAVLTDGFVEVKLKPLAGKEDQAGGVVWRWKDADNYYAARANALEDNVRIYHVVKARRVQFDGRDVKVSVNEWHSLRVDFSGPHFKVLFDQKRLFEASDETISGPGSVGVWTKADSVTLFDDFSFGGN